MYGSSDKKRWKSQNIENFRKKLARSKNFLILVA